MNLINEKITHEVFGKGKIIDHDETFITVDFEDDTKKFVYPDALGKFIKLKDRDVAESMKDILTKEKAEKELEQQKLDEEQRKQAEIAYRRNKLKDIKIHESSQVVFWIEEEEVDAIFTDWQVSTGTIQSGKNEGQPNKVARLRPNSAVLLTVRASDEEEVDRKIIGLYMVNETFSGELNDEGMITAHESYRITLTKEESDKMLFWNYYINKNYPHRTTWNSGRYRYYDNVMTAQILTDLISLKTDENEKELAERFLAYFIEMNLLDDTEIPKPNGALKQ
ncbi:hypothetical protein [Amphibacillus xylanus]|uniref:Malate synthase n=1 Tax=Amphibacillus xylanus (strain ATCC 51415 / DSM 6626 / JCM 7361 / LMG 17667 / NBRC 15112 / Ep01) TaxID=698758 RepID=K0J2S6_AMPXN|nr:hypothetical protein [Amphibacillus xylanus]BAM47442.1 hypothetical protein AXY_13100 [Amphibacillus xylanus NBRC 15112]